MVNWRTAQFTKIPKNSVVQHRGPNLFHQAGKFGKIGGKLQKLHFIIKHFLSLVIICNKTFLVS